MGSPVKGKICFIFLKVILHSIEVINLIWWIEDPTLCDLPYNIFLQRITKRTEIPAEDSDGAKESSETEEGVKISRWNLWWLAEYTFILPYKQNLINKIQIVWKDLIHTNNIFSFDSDPFTFKVQYPLLTRQRSEVTRL